MSENEPARTSVDLDQPLTEEQYEQLTPAQRYNYAKRQTELRAPNTAAEPGKV
jgi:hypothetical protein